MDRVRFYYQLIFRIDDGKFNVEMRNIRYIYDDMPNQQTYRAEKWITDEEAMNKAKTKLLKIPGKFRRFTIDRKDEIFRGAAKAAGIATTRHLPHVQHTTKTRQPDHPTFGQCLSVAFFISRCERFTIAKHHFYGYEKEN